MQNNLTTIDRNRLTPFTVGFEQLFDKLYGIENTSHGFPPYNINKNDEYSYTIEMALAGYNKKDITIELAEGELSISSEKNDEYIEEHTSLIHKGISNKNFMRKFTLSDEVKVDSAEMKDGMLYIQLKREIPEHRKPKSISIK
tara:strand:+ start:10 stop:438 length:429 start_codon:yes stop_codon:yes gene_type:complete